MPPSIYIINGFGSPWTSPTIVHWPLPYEFSRMRDAVLLIDHCRSPGKMAVDEIDRKNSSDLLHTLNAP